MDTINLFYVGSYSHLIVADAIISEKHLPLDKVLFVTYRGVKLPECYVNRLLFDESIISGRLIFFIKNFRKLNRVVKGKKIFGYFPFQQEFPVLKFFSEYFFFEEGLSAYDSSLNFNVFDRKRFIKQTIKQKIISLFLNRNLSGLYNGRNNGSPFSFGCTLVGLTKESYQFVQINDCSHEVVHFTGKPLKQSSIKNSVIIVMDSTHASDRMESADNYLKILSDVLKEYDFKSKNIYLKLHPDNFGDIDNAIKFIKSYLHFIDFTIIDESLEDIALSNQHNTFIGNHSTILFYAPIYGDTNKSVSIARITAERDSVYSNWIKRWGGIDGLMSLFKKQVNCL